MLQDYKLGLRMLLKYPGLTIAGGLALAFAIGIGAGSYDLVGKLLAPTIPLPDGDRIVLIEMQNTLTNAPEPLVVRDFLEWRRALRLAPARAMCSPKSCLARWCSWGAALSLELFSCCGASRSQDPPADLRTTFRSSPCGLERRPR